MPTCPKCGFSQDSSEECMRCGIIFSRYHGYSGVSALPETGTKFVSRAAPKSGAFRYCYRIFRWVSLIVLVATLVLILWPASPPPVVTSAEAAQTAEAKVKKFQSSVQSGGHEILDLDASELNGWLESNLAIQKPAPKLPWEDHKGGQSIDALARKAMAPISHEEPVVDAARANVREVRMDLKEDSLITYVAFELYGLAISLELEGKLSVENGYLKLEPIRGKLGSLPLLAGTLEGATHRLLEAPENREKFKLPPQISNISIQEGRLLVSSR